MWGAGGRAGERAKARASRGRGVGGDVYERGRGGGYRRVIARARAGTWEDYGECQGEGVDRARGRGWGRERGWRASEQVG